MILPGLFHAGSKWCCRADAVDILQEVAVVLWRKFDQFEPGSRFDPWADCVARNQTLCYRQKRQRDRPVLMESPVDVPDHRAALAVVSKPWMLDVCRRRD